MQVGQSLSSNCRDWNYGFTSLDVWKLIRWSIKLVWVPLAWKLEMHHLLIVIEQCTGTLFRFWYITFFCFANCEREEDYVGSPLFCQLYIMIHKKAIIMLFACPVCLQHTSEWNRWAVETFSVPYKAEWKGKNIQCFSVLFFYMLRYFYLC